MYTVYVLYSAEFDKIYIGYSSDVDSRLESHNSLANKGWTLRYRPWILFYREEYQDKKLAMDREKQLKSAKGREFIWNIIKERKADF
ncbi:hypothetical protein SDC9_83052 [bioreactor metagenome]|uniref:GIY-YIG domain-containing protein n=1 Tax=bioreactor metagenome TaxID=1076179 RepID=A0A644Z6G4_9ZZZZ